MFVEVYHLRETPNLGYNLDSLKITRGVQAPFKADGLSPVSLFCTIFYKKIAPRYHTRGTLI